MRPLRIASLAVAAGLVLAVFAARAQTDEPRKLTVTAKKYEFDPPRIELKVGEPVEITFMSADTKHGFVCKELGLEKVEFTQDKPETVRFTPDKAGTFPFKCAKYCGSGHGKMKGEIVVSP